MNRPLVVDLTDAAATETALTGGKAANLAIAATSGLSTMGGVVLTTAFSDDIDAGAAVTGHAAVREAFDRARGDEIALVARSSSVVEDSADSSMAGQFDSIIGIRGFDEFTIAVDKVLGSRARAGAENEPIAVLVQPLLDPRYGGVMFGVDPVSGRSDWRVVSAVFGGPEALVSGEVRGSRYVLRPDGKELEFDQNDGPKIEHAGLKKLADLSAAVAKVFGGPQDVEWAIEQNGAVRLLQSRPVTTEVRGVPRGPIYGPGPIAETFPEPLTELEYDLWVPPLRDALREAVTLTGAAKPKEMEKSEFVIGVRGYIAIDLKLSGEIKPKTGFWQKLNPVPAAHVLRGAWRVGRLRAVLPRLAEDLLDRVDRDLEAVPQFTELTTRQLIGLLRRSHAILRSLHTHEILMGMLTDTGSNRMTGASVALRVLVEARRDGLSDEEVLERSPIVLALAPPRVAPAPEFPADASAIHLGSDEQNMNDNGILREALRLHVRWMQELSGRAAWEVGVRLTALDQLTEPALIRHMTLEHVEAVATKRAVVIPALVEGHAHKFGSPLPAAFQLSDRGKAIRVRLTSETGGGTGAGGGVNSGPVTHDVENPPNGSVLVTTTLQPGLAPLLTRLNGIVAETGSVLSHLAILAREAKVATVVGYEGAVDELAEGVIVQVDGESGQVTVQEKDAS